MIIKKGDKFNKLTAIKFSHWKGTAQHWLFKCECGNTKVIQVNAVKRGNTKACGCLQSPHGMWKTKIYQCWRNMKQRCFNPNVPIFKHYGGRGIIVCPRWLGEDGFINFLADMGERPDNKSLDRINNDGNYEPDNCRWATQKEQCNNMRTNKK